jgi:two-component system sensor histidine kinase KdpD
MATFLGSAAVGAVALTVALLHQSLGQAAQGLLLVVPVVATAVLGGRRPGQVVAALATLMFLLILPPAGSFHLRFADDAVALVVFMAVAFAVGGLVAVRVEVLGQLERHRAALLRSVSHDLRSPLTAMSAAVSELQDATPYSPQQRQRLLSLVGDEADRLDRLVGNLLSLARVEGGGLKPRLQAVDLGELVDVCARRLQRTVPGAEIVLDARAGVPAVHADHTLLEQVVTNLLENAIRHNAPGQPVEVVVRGDSAQVRVMVSDAGPGIAAEELDIVFEPFRSGPTGGASGMGLAICEAVVKAHGGTIAVSESSRGGAAFTVTLPVR